MSQKQTCFGRRFGTARQTAGPAARPGCRCDSHLVAQAKLTDHQGRAIELHPVASFGGPTRWTAFRVVSDSRRPAAVRFEHVTGFPSVNTFCEGLKLLVDWPKNK